MQHDGSVGTGPVEVLGPLVTELELMQPAPPSFAVKDEFWEHAQDVGASFEHRAVENAVGPLLPTLLAYIDRALDSQNWSLNAPA